MKIAKNNRLWIINQNLNDNIFIFIMHIKFQNLLHLNLLPNYLTNIQGLTFINAPNLEKIMAANNDIVNISATLSKIYFKKIVMIVFYGNPLNEVDIGRLQVYKNQLDFRINLNAVNDISFFAKDKYERRGEILIFKSRGEQVLIEQIFPLLFNLIVHKYQVKNGYHQIFTEQSSQREELEQNQQYNDIYD